MYQPSQFQRRTPPVRSSSERYRERITLPLQALFAGWLLFGGGILTWRGISHMLVGSMVLVCPVSSIICPYFEPAIS